MEDAEDAADQFVATLSINTTGAAEVVSDAIHDAYAAGAKDGVDQLSETGRDLPDGGTLARVAQATDWSSWSPGHVKAADIVLNNPGLDQLLKGAQVTIKDTTDKMRAEIAQALAESLMGGENLKDRTDRISKIINDPQRAELIARTEVNRAMTQASIASYGEAQLTEFNLLTSPGACPVCDAIAADNPHPLTDLASQPPIHPRCRCAAQPVV